MNLSVTTISMEIKYSKFVLLKLNFINLDLKISVGIYPIQENAHVAKRIED